MTASRRVADVAAQFWERQARWAPDVHGKAGLPIEHLPRGSHEEAVAQASDARDLLGTLSDLEPEALDGDDADTLRFLRHASTLYDAEADHFWLMRTATPYQTWIQHLSLVDSVFRPYVFAAADDVDRYVALAHDFGCRIDQIEKNLRGQLERGVVIPKRALGGAVESMTSLRKSVAKMLAVHESRLSALDPTVREALAQRTSALVEERIVPAVDRVLAVLTSSEYAAAAPDGVGSTVQPGGEEAYRFLVRRETGMDTTPEALHQLGLEQCADLTERMRRVRASLGFDVSETDFRDVLRQRTSLYARTPQELEERYLAYMARIEPLIDDYFSVLPQAPYGVARASADVEAGMTFGYYEIPTSADPVGRYRYNGSDLPERSLLTAAAVIYHELVPGHHFHIARQLESADLPSFRRHGLALCGSFSEGWAEYASGLGWEMGLYDDPWDAYGRLAHERFVAARLVLDTALNCGWWTWEQAAEFMRANTHESESQMSSELVRYSTDLPAQGLGYRAGFLGITRLRDEAERRTGDAFDIRAFHEAVLGGGAMPLTVLEPRLARELPGRLS